LLVGNQYTYEGNQYLKEIHEPKENEAPTYKRFAAQECLSGMIVNQEQGKCPIEYTNQLSRAKIYDMKRLKCPDNVRNYNSLYQE
jgi:hypothetical protein